MVKPIRILDRLRPFSHRVGTQCLIPKTFYAAEIFPSLVRLFDLSLPHQPLIGEIQIALEGALKEFTVQLDLEKEILKVWGKSSQGWLRYYFKKSIDGNNLSLVIQKNEPKREFFLDPSLKNLCIKEPVILPQDVDELKDKERLSLGSNRQLNWDRVSEQCDFKEIFPCWHFLAQMLPQQYQKYAGSWDLLDNCEEALKQKKENLLEPFTQLFLFAFKGILVPQFRDERHQGIVSKGSPLDSPLFILSQGAQLLRRLFIEQKDRQVHLLPHLPPQFFCGRMTKVKCGSLGDLNFEWTKKKLRRMEFIASNSNNIDFQFPAFLKNFRLRTNLKEKGLKITCGETLSFQANQKYFFDRFE